MNSLDFADALAGGNRKSAGSTGSNSNSSAASTLARKITGSNGNNNAQALAAIQYLSATTEVPEARAALKHGAFKSVPIEAFIAASTGVNKIMKEADLPDSEVKAFISSLLRKIERS